MRLHTFCYLVALLTSSLLAFLPMVAIEYIRSQAENALTGNSAWPMGASTSTIILPLDLFRLIMLLAGLVLFILLFVSFLSIRNRGLQIRTGRIACAIYAAGIVAMVLASMIPLSFVYLDVSGKVLLNGYSKLPLTFWFCIFAAGILFVLLGNRGVREQRDRWIS
jgi:hypothetical protein